MEKRNANQTINIFIPLPYPGGILSDGHMKGNSFAGCLFVYCFRIRETKNFSIVLTLVVVVIIIYITGWLITMESKVKGKRQLWLNRIIPSYKLHPQPSRHYDAILRLKGPAGWLLPNIFFSSFFCALKGSKNNKREGSFVGEKYHQITFG